MLNAEKSVTAATAVTLDALDVVDRDQAAARLLARYAAELDAAAAIDAHALRVLERAYAESDTTELIDEVTALRQKLSARTALVTVGARMEALLSDLGATPGGRAKQSRGKPAESAPTGGAMARMKLARRADSA